MAGHETGWWALEPVYVGSFSYSLGDQKCHVSDSEARGRLVSSAADLMSAGFRWHHICGPRTTAYDLARSAVTPVADQAGGADAIVYATCLPRNGNAGDEGDWLATRDVKFLMDFPVSRLAAEFGLDRAIAFGLNQQACTALLGSLRLASALLAVEPGWQRVLCVTADRFPEGAVYEQAYNLISDGGAACVVGRQPLPGTFRLLACHQITNGGLGQATDDETVGSYFSYTSRLVAQTLGRAGLAAQDIDWVVTQNTNEKAWAILSRVIGVDFARVVFPTLPDAGHVISADNVLNLLALADSGRIRPGDKLLVVMAGFGLNWQATVLEAV
jgi:3-oxoacyl-[acyl-carrier-protein] synthase-3